MKIKNISFLIATFLTCSINSHGIAYAGGFSSDFKRFPADGLSGSGHSVNDACGGDYRHAQASLDVFQISKFSYVNIEVERARPNTLYTVWLRVRGETSDGSTFGGSPLTGGSATPLAPGSDLEALYRITPPNEGSMEVSNGFKTNRRGSGRLTIALDFPIMGGAYPFNKMPDGLIADAQEIPVAIVNPKAPGVEAPYMLRMVSHCQDGLGHGLSPGDHETWFDWPDQP